MLRALLGDDAFGRALAHYLGKHRHGVVESRDLARAVEDATGKNVDWFFSQWVIDGAGHPELDVKLGWDPDEKLASIAVEQTQKVEGKTPLFRISTLMRYRIDGVDRDVPIELTDAKHSFYIPLPSEPSHAIFDPGRVVLASVKVTKPEPVWIAELAGATLATDRTAAAQALARRGGPAAERALSAGLVHDRYWAVRGACAIALAVLRSDVARDRLIRALGVEVHPRARRMIARALGDFVRDAAAGAALAQLVERGDASYFVEAEACLALGKTRTARAPELLRAAAQRESFTDVIRQHAYRGLAEARDDSAIGLLVEGTKWGHPTQGRRAATNALAQLMRGRRDREARDVRERLAELLADRDFRVQAAAIEALAVLGDPAAIPALHRMIERELDGRLRRRGREIVRDLEDGAPLGEDVRRLRDELGELRALAGALRERMDLLEAKGGGGLGSAAHAASKSKHADKATKRADKASKADRKAAKHDKAKKK
jgi:aminopeptidase N